MATVPVKGLSNCDKQAGVSSTFFTTSTETNHYAMSDRKQWWDHLTGITIVGTCVHVVLLSSRNCKWLMEIRGSWYVVKVGFFRLLRIKFVYCPHVPHHMDNNNAFTDDLGAVWQGGQGVPSPLLVPSCVGLKKVSNPFLSSPSFFGQKYAHKKVSSQPYSILHWATMVHFHAQISFMPNLLPVWWNGKQKKPTMSIAERHKRRKNRCLSIYSIRIYCSGHFIWRIF